MLGADIFTARFARTRSIGPPADEMRPSGVYNLLFISCNKPFSRRVDTVCNSAAATVSQPISVMSVIIFSMRQNVKTTAVYYYHCYYIIIRARAPGSFFVFFSTQNRLMKYVRCTKRVEVQRPMYNITFDCAQCLS